MTTPAKSEAGLVVWIAAVASLGAAIVHAAVMPAHWQEWPPSGLFFALLALFQFGWAAVVVACSRAIALTAGIAANLAAIALWVPSRTAGLPFGPHAGEPEAVRAAGIAAVLLEAVVVASAAWVLFRANHADTISGPRFTIVLAGAAATVTATVTVGVISGLQHGSHTPGSTGGHDDHRHPPKTELADDTQIIESPAAPQPRTPEPANDHDHVHNHG